MLTTTFKELREAGACKPSYNLLYNKLNSSFEDDTPISMRCIYQNLNLGNTIWVIIHVCKRGDLLFNLLGKHYKCQFQLNTDRSPYDDYVSCLDIISWIRMYSFDNFSIFSEGLHEEILKVCDKEENGDKYRTRD